MSPRTRVLQLLLALLVLLAVLLAPIWTYGTEARLLVPLAIPTIDVDLPRGRR